MTIEFHLVPGTLKFTNNPFIRLSRSSFEVSPGANQRRWLVRLWLRDRGQGPTRVKRVTFD
jgi:hypothetical protein